MLKYKGEDGISRMRNFNYTTIKNQKWDTETLSLVGAIYKKAGKLEYFLAQQPHKLEKLKAISKIQSISALSSLENIPIAPNRIKQLVEDKETPQSEDEQELAGYRDALTIINKSFESIPITRKNILQLHKILNRHMNNPMAGKMKNVQNYIKTINAEGRSEVMFMPLSPFETPDALEKICEEYNRLIAGGAVDPLIAIPVFIHDFLCIHPFNDGNGSLSRLLTTLLFYRSGFTVGRYVSLEAKLAKNKDGYYEALKASQYGWHDGTEDVVPFVKFILGTLFEAYKELEESFNAVDSKMSAVEMVRKATRKKVGRFSKQDVMALCPSLSISSVEGALRKLVIDGELRRDGNGKAIRYLRIKQ